MLLTGLIGHSILSSRSPWLHEQEAAAQGIDLSYELFDFSHRGLADEALGPFLRDLADRGYAGVNITFPFKQQVIPLLDELAPCANAVGAVNTIAMREGRLIGYNTDKLGFQTSFVEGLPNAALNRVLQFGAGGAGAAVANALLSLGCKELLVTDLDMNRAEELVARLGHHYGPDRARACEAVDVTADLVDGFINTTPMGMASHPGPVMPPDMLDPRHWVADIVYFPLETQLLREARARGCATLDGSGMVVNQAALAFEIFTGMPALRERMMASFLRGEADHCLPQKNRGR